MPNDVITNKSELQAFNKIFFCIVSFIFNDSGYDTKAAEHLRINAFAGFRRTACALCAQAVLILMSTEQTVNFSADSGIV